MLIACTYIVSKATQPQPNSHVKALFEGTQTADGLFLNWELPSDGLV